MRRIIATLLALAVAGCCAACAAPVDDGRGASSSATSVQGPTGQGAVYTIADYYNDDGTLSALGMALPQENGEPVLAVAADDLIVVGERSYTVLEDTLALPFYTQPSLDEVMGWWADHMEGLKADGRVR